MSMVLGTNQAVVVTEGVGSPTVDTPASGRRFRIVGWDLGVSQNTAVATVQILIGGTQVARAVFDLNGSGVATGGVAPAKRWSALVLPIPIDGATNGAITLSIAGTGAIVDGQIYYQTMP